MFSRAATSQLNNKRYSLLKILSTIFLAFVFLLQISCALDIQNYRQTKPVLDLEQFFQGDLIAWGIVQSRNGELQRHFKVKISANWVGDKCYLKEDFIFNDGEKQHRLWTITKHSPNKYTGVADDVMGTAQGIAYGNALNWNYTLKLPINGGAVKVKFDDWMYLLDKDTLVNKAKIKKFGFRVGDVTLFFRKQG